MRLPDHFQDQDKPEKQYAEAGLDADGDRRHGAEGAAPQQRRSGRGRAGVNGGSALLLVFCAGLLPISIAAATEPPAPPPAEVSDEQTYRDAMQCKVRVEALAAIPVTREINIPVYYRLLLRLIRNRTLSFV